MTNSALILGASILATCLAACSTQQAYGTAQEWQRNQCNRIPDKREYDRCMETSSTTYESYRRQTEQK